MKYMNKAENDASFNLSSQKKYIDNKSGKISKIEIAICSFVISEGVSILSMARRFLIAFMFLGSIVLALKNSSFAL